ncbi:hypothetical protein HYV74_04305 [Candidatus Uhrbacteria bacterium]|nr:hypothetical protein [Candidatus Uhrbacteria bacterium]
MDSSFGGRDRITDRQLRWGAWYVEHRAQLQRLGRWIAIGVTTMIGLYALWRLTWYGAVEWPRFLRSARVWSTPNNARGTYVAQLRPKPPVLGEVMLIANGGTSYDAVAQVSNPNARWVGIMTYELEVPGAEPQVLRTTLLPGRDRWITRLNAVSTTNPTRATLVIRETVWERISLEASRDPERYVSDRLRVEIVDPKFVPPAALVLQTGTPSVAVSGGAPVRISRATFGVRNTSAYTFRELELDILLRRGSGIVGVNRVTISDLVPGEQRAVAATWFQPLGLVQSVEVIPYTDVFNPGSFVTR